MTTSKIEPRLRQELDRIQVAGQAGQTIPVLIQLSPRDATQSGDIADLEREFTNRQASLRERLAEIGVHGEIRQLALANSLEAGLTPAQINTIAGHPEVQRIIWNRADQVVA